MRKLLASFARLSIVQRISVVVIAAAIPLGVVGSVLRSDASTGPIYSVEQVMTSVDAAGVRHHANPQAIDSDVPNSCAVIEAPDRGHVREVYRTQLQVGDTDAGDIDLSIIAYESSGRAARAATNREREALAGNWIVLRNANLYVEIQGPRSALPPEVVERITEAVNSITTPAVPQPPVLHC